MAFADISGFTAITQCHGVHHAARLVSNFRSIVRRATGQHEVRVARWIGDGVIIVGTDVEHVVAALKDIVKSCNEQDIPIHSGMAAGEVLIFEGDDYLGRTLNIACRLAAKAEPGQVMAYGVDSHPITLQALCKEDVVLRGVGEIFNVSRIELS